MNFTAPVPMARYGSVYVTADTLRDFWKNDGSKTHGFSMTAAATC
jgi:hypothetical protein